MFRIAVIVPTGIAAEIGGFAGDAGIVVNYLAGIADEVITHPNVVNAASFNTIPDNAYYVEGHALDQFFAGEWGFQKTHQKIGMVIDRACAPYLELIENAVNATVMSTGIQFMGYTLTEQPLTMELFASNYKHGGYGGYTGNVGNVETLINAGKHCLAQGATALAVLTWMDVLAEGLTEDYEQNGGVDPIGAVEAMISHALTEALQVPVAHSPIFEPRIVRHRLDPRVAAEEIGTTYLPCILMGLNKAPRLVASTEGDFQKHEVSAVITPADACGGLSVLEALESGIPVIAVKENRTALNVTLNKMGWTANKARFKGGEIYEVENYWEAAGVLQALKMGMDPHLMRRPVQGVFKPIS